MASESQVWIYSFGMTHSSSLRGHLRPWKSARAQQTPPVGMWLDPGAPSPSPSHSSLGHLALHFPSAPLLQTLQSPRLLSHQFTRIIKHPVDKQDRTVFFSVCVFFSCKSSLQKKTIFSCGVLFCFVLYLMLWTRSLSISVHKEFSDSFFFLAF